MWHNAVAFKYFWSEGVVVESGLVEGGGVGIAKLRHEIWQNGAIKSRRMTIVTKFFFCV